VFQSLRFSFSCMLRRDSFSHQTRRRWASSHRKARQELDLNNRKHEIVIYCFLHFSSLLVTVTVQTTLCSMTDTEIFEVSSEHQQDLIQWLAPYIPTCIALYRRIQFGHFEPGARLLSSIDFARFPHERKSKDPWIIAYVDRACRPETEVWLAASWEHDTPTDDSKTPYADDLVKAMIKKISQLETPPKAGTIVDPEKATDEPSAANGSVLADRDQFLSHMQNENIVLFGSVHRATFTILERLGFVDPDSAEVSGIPYRKYMFDIKNE